MNVRILRSARRRKTISAKMEGDTLIIQAPAHLSDRDLQPIIERLKGRLKRKEKRVPTSDTELDNLALKLARQFLDMEERRWRSIRWVDNQKQRYGSCTPGSGDIRISSRLQSCPDFVRDYVIIHELAHLLEANHSSRFWALVGAFPLAERARGYLMALGAEED